MFAYCNNPVMYSDPTGAKIFECCPYGDCYYCKAEKNSAPPSTPSISTTPVPTDTAPGEVEYGFTYSNGLGASANVGFFAFTGQGGISLDAEGNIGVQFTLSYSINASATGSDYGVSVGSYNMLTNAQNIYKLEGDGYQVGFGATAPIPNTSMNGFAESNLVIVPTVNPDKCYLGYSDFKGISTLGSADFNCHFTGGYTFETLWGFNVFELFGG